MNPAGDHDMGDVSSPPLKERIGRSDLTKDAFDGVDRTRGHMDESDSTEPALMRYLLGDLPEHEQVRVEDRAFSDREYQQLIEAVEADLIDAYVRPTATGSFRSMFKSGEIRIPTSEIAMLVTRRAGTSQANPVVSFAVSERALNQESAWWSIDRRSDAFSRGPSRKRQM